MNYFISGTIWQQFWLVTAVLLLRYWLIASGIHFVVWIWGRTRLAAYHIQKTPPLTSSIKREMYWSMFTIPVFGLTAFFLSLGISHHFVFVEGGALSEYGFGRALLYFLGFLFLHDIYFYWLHRLMHHPYLYRKVHLVHHQSTNPSAFAALSFHPIESVLEMLFFPVAVVALPHAHIMVIALFFLFDFFINSLAHSGVEWIPSRFLNTWFGGWINTATHHNLHHQKVNGNYSFYFLFWDRLCGTLMDES